MSEQVNVASRMTAFAKAQPAAMAVAAPARNGRSGRAGYRTVTFLELDRDSDRLARGLLEWGVPPGTRLALLVRPGIEFVTLVFALLKAGMVIVLIDPGMGRGNLLNCLEEAAPQGFVALPIVQAVRWALRRRFARARFNVTVGHRWFWDGLTLDQLRGRPWTEGVLASTVADDPAAIIFTSGSTGPPKGVLYRHANFDRQVTEIQGRYAIAPGGVDLAAFPLFGLFNAAMGVTTIVPEMDASRPARVDPARLTATIQDWDVTQSFASPAVWNRVSAYCAQRSLRLANLRQVFSAGAPVPPRVLARMLDCINPSGVMHTPYGATEALPVATISAAEVLAETATQTAQGAGTCVGQRFPGIDWRIIRSHDGPVADISAAVELPRGEIGELIVRGAVVTDRYVTRVEANPLAKIQDGKTFWHRMGDVGYLDAQDRFWYCGRLSQRVRTAHGVMYTDPCESIMNEHPAVFRSALVGVGAEGAQRPAIVVEPWPDQWPVDATGKSALIEELRQRAAAHSTTAEIVDFLLRRELPVDVRHNAKISRETLAVWAARRLGVQPR